MATGAAAAAAAGTTPGTSGEFRSFCCWPRRDQDNDSLHRFTLYDTPDSDSVTPVASPAGDTRTEDGSAWAVYRERVLANEDDRAARLDKAVDALPVFVSRLNLTRFSDPLIMS